MLRWLLLLGLMLWAWPPDCISNGWRFSGAQFLYDAWAFQHPKTCNCMNCRLFKRRSRSLDSREGFDLKAMRRPALKSDGAAHSRDPGGAGWLLTRRLSAQKVLAMADIEWLASSNGSSSEARSSAGMRRSGASEALLVRHR